jgi:hypothetical protein
MISLGSLFRYFACMSSFSKTDFLCDYLNSCMMSFSSLSAGFLFAGATGTFQGAFLSAGYSPTNNPQGGGTPPRQYYITPYGNANDDNLVPFCQGVTDSSNTIGANAYNNVPQCPMTPCPQYTFKCPVYFTVPTAGDYSVFYDISSNDQASSSPRCAYYILATSGINFVYPNGPNAPGYQNQPLSSQGYSSATVAGIPTSYVQCSSTAVFHLAAGDRIQVVNNLPVQVLAQYAQLTIKQVA